MTWRSILLLGVVAGACADPIEDPGTSVGNPNLTLVKVAPGGLGVEITKANLPFSSVTVSNAAETVEVDLPTSNDVLAGAPLDLPTGDWTQLSLQLDGTLNLAGTESNATIDLELDVAAVTVRSERSPLETGEPHVFELAFPGWLEAQNTGWVSGEDHTIRQGDPIHDTLVDSIQQRSAYLPDADRDGEPDR